jgi:hypothetical protein
MRASGLGAGPSGRIGLSANCTRACMSPMRMHSSHLRRGAWACATASSKVQGDTEGPQEREATQEIKKPVPAQTVAAKAAFVATWASCGVVCYSLLDGGEVDLPPLDTVLPQVCSLACACVTRVCIDPRSCVCA